uniref:Uncharacterized protein n=1 Tax=Myotis myotis TaxID=51298 RepID=A0A7J7YEY8_MYOMY|nr:hypothetical protein mMyoMyo1_011018 [Myotis myotis]
MGGFSVSWATAPSTGAQDRRVGSLSLSQATGAAAGAWDHRAGGLSLFRAATWLVPIPLSRTHFCLASPHSFLMSSFVPGWFSFLSRKLICAWLAPISLLQAHLCLAGPHSSLPSVECMSSYGMTA